MIAHTTGTPVLQAAAKYVDVASFNHYDILPELAGPLLNADPTYLSVENGLALQEQILNKPILISEWTYRAADSGLPNTFPPLFPTLQTQAQRAAAYEAYVKKLLATNYVVGQHWFEHAHEPPAGRFDGEDSNFGLVDGSDDPYPLLTEISKTMHDCAYESLLAAVTTTATTTATTTKPELTTTAEPTTTSAPGPEAQAAAAVSATPSFTG